MGFWYKGVLAQYLSVWDLVSHLVLQPEVEDTHIWRFSASGKYSAKSAYEAMFIGSIQFRLWERIWKTWAPNKCKFFLWLAACDRCWTADRLVRKGLGHPEKCPFCDQEEEMINHLLLSCVFYRQAWRLGSSFCENWGCRHYRHNPGSFLLMTGGNSRVKKWRGRFGRALIPS
jgi:hypothetical protein